MFECIKNYLWDIKIRRKIKKHGYVCIYNSTIQSFIYNGSIGKYLPRTDIIGWFMPDGTDAIISASPKEIQFID